jgi:fibronectin type 3 domain-containing protein
MYLDSTVKTLFFLSLFVLLTVNTGVCQAIQQTFVDSEPKPDSYVNDVVHEGAFAYVGGISSNACSRGPFISKISLETGEIDWNTINSIVFDYDYPHVMREIEVIGDYVFGVSEHLRSGEQAELWKVNKNTGAVIWKIFLSTGANHESSIHSYSDTHLIVQAVNRLHLINSSTGAIENIQNDIIGNSYPFSGVGRGQVIYMGSKKVTNFDFANPLPFIPDFDPAICPSGSIARVHQISDTRALAFGNRDCEHRVFLVDLTNNQVIWNSGGIGDYVVSDFKIRGNYLYLSLEAAFIGGPMVYVKIRKIDISNGTLEWNSTNLYANASGYTEQPVYSSYNQGSSVSIDLDDSGNVYLTGVANAQGDEGDMGIMKLSGATGEKLFEKVVTEDDRDFDKSCQGVKAMIYNGMPCFIGNVIEQAYFSFSGSTFQEGAGNNIVLVRLNPSDGAVLTRYNYKGMIEEPSSVKQILPYKTTDLLVLENRGRYAYISRYDKNMTLVWSKHLKHKNYYGHDAARMAVDHAGNILITAKGIHISTYFDKGEGSKSIAFLVDENGIVLQEVRLDAGLQLYNDLYCDGENFFVYASSSSYGDLYKINTSGLIGHVGISLFNTSAHPGTRRLAGKSGNEVVILGEYLQMAVVNTNTMIYTKPGIDLAPGPNNPDPYDMMIRNDTLYTVNYNKYDVSFNNLTCYSFLTNQTIWTGPTATTNSGNRPFRMIFDDQGNMFTLGTGQYQGFLLQRINRKTGAIQWSQLRTYSLDFEATNLFYDKARNEIVVTGYSVVSGVNRYATAMFSAGTGAPVLVDISTSLVGAGVAIGQAGNGDIITGGHVTAPDHACTTTSLLASYQSSMLSTEVISASEGMENQVTISWTSQHQNAFFRVYRNTVDNGLTAQPVTGWITTTSFNDVTAQVATSYYYFVRSAKTSSGSGISPFSAGDYGYRGLARPIMSSVQGSETSTLEVTWAPLASAAVYRVFRGSTNIAAHANAISSWISSTSYVDTNVVPGTRYYYFVQAAVNSTAAFTSQLSDGKSGILSLLSTEVVTASEGLENYITVSWTTSNPNAFFKVYRNTVNFLSTAHPISDWINTTYVNDNTALIATDYYYFVQAAADNMGTAASLFSSGDYGFRGIPRPVVTAVNVTESNHLSVIWTEVSGAVFYRLYRGSDESETNAQALTGWIQELEYTDLNAEPGTTYFYFLSAAQNTDGKFQSAFSAGIAAASENILAIEDSDAALSFEVYPNPIKESFTISYNSDYKGSIAIIFLDGMGKPIKQLTEAKNNPYFEKQFKLQAGISGYMIVLISENGHLRRKKLLKY